MIVGIDEAGKGCVIGDLFIAGYGINEEDIGKLKKIGVKDSKLLSPKKREEIYKEIVEIGKFILKRISVKEIDERVKNEINLNELEAKYMGEIINELKPNKVIIDCPTLNENTFRKYLDKYVKHKCKIILENYADRNYLVVGAASIIAKVNRDKALREIEKKINWEFNNGYPNDEKVIELLNNIEKHKDALPYIRKSWMTFERIIEEKRQKKLSDFFKVYKK